MARRWDDEFNRDEPTTGVVGAPPEQEPPRSPTVQVLRAMDQAEVGRTFTLRNETVFGRGAEATVTLNDAGISRQHAKIVRQGDTFRIIDLGSKNGTWVNGKRVESAELKPGDQIQVGGTIVLRYSVETSDARLREALKAARVATWDWRAEDGQVAFSEHTDALLGLPPGTLGSAARPLLELVHADERGAVQRALAEAVASGSKVDVEFRLAGAGATRWMHLKGDVLHAGGHASITGTVMEVSPRREAEQELRRHALIFESLPDPLFVTDLEGRVVDANPAAERLFRVSRAEATGRDVLALLGSPAGMDTAAITGAVRAVGRWAGELELKDKDGLPVVCDVVAAPVRKSINDAVGLMVTLRDVRERRRLQTQLALAERLAAMGTMSAGLAHEINNPLAFVIANLEYLRTELQRLAPGLPRHALLDLGEVLSESEEGTRRIASIVHDLKAFARDEATTGEPGPVDARRAVELALKMASHNLRHRARLVVALEEVPLVVGFEHRLAQVVLNLLINAGQAIPEHQAASAEIRVRTFVERPGWVAIEVSDTGQGIAADVLPRIFDPFFTTKPAGVGTGLGLSIVHGIVTSLGGRLAVESSPGRGSSFLVSLRTADAEGAAVQTPLPAPELSARVLVVDDEPLVVSSLARNLRGHDVTGAHSAQGALELLEAGQFDVVVCDLMMPEMTGMDLHAATRVKHPALASRFIFITGGAFTENARRFANEVQLPLLAKPVDLDALRRAIASVVQASPR